MFDPGEDIGEYLKQFGVNASMLNWDVLKSVCTFFLNGRECGIEELTNSLSSDLIQRIEDVIYGCEYLAEDGNERVSADEVLKNLQFNPQFHEKHEFAHTDEGFREFVKTREKEFAEYIPPITLATLDRWKSRAKAISSMVLHGAALDAYSDIDRMLCDIQETVGQAVYEFDEWVNMQVHDRGL